MLKDNDFKIKRDDGCSTVLCYSGTSSHVIVPEYIEGYRVTEIGSYAFAKSNAKYVALPRSCIKLHPNAFSDSQIVSVELPASLSYVADFAFANCSKLRSIYVPENNENFTSIDGVLFDKDCSWLIHYPAAKSDISYAVPVGVQFIDTGAFDGNQNLQRVWLPDSVADISPQAFNECENLKYINIPKRIFNLRSCIFCGCNELTVSVPSDKVVFLRHTFDNCKDVLIKCNPETLTWTSAKINGLSVAPLESELSRLIKDTHVLNDEISL